MTTLFYTTFRNKTWQNDWVAFEVKKQKKKILFMHKNVFTLPVGVTSSYTEGEPDFPRQNNVVLSKKLSGVDKVVNFKDFS